MIGGVTHLSLDPKNRLAVPARYRDAITAHSHGRLIITLESPQCLLLYPEANWEVVRQRVQELPTGSHPLVKSYQRLVLGHAENLELDKAGRILLPSTLRALADLKKDVVLVGLGNRFELWDSAKWQAETDKALQMSQDDLATLLNGFSL
jgi:MraZ protein